MLHVYMSKDCTSLYLACAQTLVTVEERNKKFFPLLPCYQCLHTGYTLPWFLASFCISFSDFEDPSAKPLFSSQDRDRNRQHYPFVFDSLATRKQAAAYVGGSKVFLINYSCFHIRKNQHIKLCHIKGCLCMLKIRSI